MGAQPSTLQLSQNHKSHEAPQVTDKADAWWDM